MSQLTYECDYGIKNNSEDSAPFKPCSPDKYCILCNAQCCLTIQRRVPRHFWESWYFWLGVGLLLIFIVSTTSSFLINYCKQNVFSFVYRPRNSSTAPNNNNNNTPNPRNEIAINIISPLPSHAKMLLVTPQSSCGYMTPVVA
ncbi:uncharacterized protein LOC127290496 [Leptopilina boulardi]|uniref:uncharacterized protein LOC127290496 n=1 Tax=Leptopilina boulardi TaxID=63433 RepID=UPI0021F67721|nr:uncharacterized protein LOC127290496 [Leptopilina boulardi]